MSTAYKQIELIQATAAKHGLEVVRMTWSPTEYRVYVKDHVTGMLFQGDENRTSDFVTGWIARGESLKG